MNAPEMSASSVSSPAVFYAAADQFLPASAHAVSLPCSNAQVDGTALGVQMLAVSLADWLAQGLITLQFVEAKKMFVFHTTDTLIHLTAGAAERLPQTGMAGWLARSVAAHPGGKAYDIVRAAFGVDYPSPVGVLIGMASEELVAAGFYDEETREAKGLGGILRKAVHAAPKMETVAVPNCERLAELRAQAPRLKQMLAEARQRDTHAWETLEKNLKTALDSRVEQQDNGPNLSSD